MRSSVLALGLLAFISAGVSGCSSRKAPTSRRAERIDGGTTDVGPMHATRPSSPENAVRVVIRDCFWELVSPANNGVEILRDPVRWRRQLTLCVRLYARTACQEAWRQSWESRKPHLAEVIATCLKAYCPVLPEPQPSACLQSSATGLLLPLIRNWAEVDMAISKMELPDASDEEIKKRTMIVPLLLAQAALLPFKTPDPDDVQIMLGYASGKISVGVHCGGEIETKTMTEGLTADDELTKVIEAFQRCTRNRSVVLRSDHPFGLRADVIALVDRLRGAGAVRIHEAASGK